MVEMKDGVRLATDVYFAPGSFGMPRSVILIRTPYGKTGWAYSIAELLYLTQGYHVVIQDMRGTHDSEGGITFQLFTKSYEDGVDTINWILDKSWCNGKIGSSGASALCLNQYYYAGMAPDGLLCQQLWFGTPEMFDHAIYQGSYHKSSVETWVKSTAPENWEYQRDLIFQFFPKTNNFNSTSLSMPIGPHYSKVTVRAVHIGGFYDHFLQGTIDGYVGYDDYSAERARGHQKMVLGPWTHVNFQSQKQGELTYPSNANGFDLVTGWEIEVFDESLLGIPANWDAARVAYYLMGDCSSESNNWNYWRYAYDWPLDHVNDTWYFVADGSLDNTTTGSSNDKFTYLFDPTDPVPNLGGQNQPFDLAGPMDQTSIEDRDDVLIFETPVLTEPVETVGRIWGHLYVTSNCTDTDFTVKITDVYPDGSSMLICDGSLTTRSRKGYDLEDQELMSGDENNIYELMIDCWSTAYYFAPGHKIRIAISSSNYPRFAVNPNTGVPLAANYTDNYVAKNSILVGPDYPSGVILPRLINKEITHVVF
jgi:predicted acyl esterase